MPAPRHALVIALAALAAPSAAGAAAYRIAPAPAWVAPIAWDRGRPSPEEARIGLEFLLSDRQVRAGRGEAARYEHGVRRVVGPAGVENGSEISIEFDPSYERLVLHEVTLLRAGKRIDALAAADVKVLQREAELERRLYDGQLTVHVILKGVRVGDVVEHAYTILGENPVFGARWAKHLALASRVATGRISVRVLWPAGRPLGVRVHGAELPPAVTARGGEVEYRWDREDVAAVEAEGDLPAGVDALPWVELSDWRDWAEVARWAASVWPAAAPSPAMSAQLRRWRALPDPEARAIAALRFVQDEVRYLGIEMGASSHRAHSPAVVFERRYGDCKDKSLLLVALLRALGIEADAALVSTEAGEALDRRLPSPIEFDHVVVRARLGGEVRWLDPTRSLERGRLAARRPPSFGRALVVARGTSALEPLPEAVPSPLEVSTTFAVPRFGRPGSLTVTTRYSGARATGLRATLATTPRADLAHDYLDFYARAYPGIEPAGPLEVLDDEVSGEIAVTERYRLAPVRAGDARDFRADSIASALVEPGTVLRRLPLGIAHPLEVHETIRIELPGAPDLEPDHQRLESAGAVFTRDAAVLGHAYVAEFRLRTKRAAIAPREVSAHVAAVREMRAYSGFTVPLAVLAGEKRSGGAGGGVLAMAILGACVAIALGAAACVSWLRTGGVRDLLQRARRRAFARKFRMARGDAPATAIAVRTERELARRAERCRCACGALLVPRGPPDRVLYDGREVSVVPLGCERCGAVRPVYFSGPG